MFCIISSLLYTGLSTPCSYNSTRSNKNCKFFLGKNTKKATRKNTESLFRVGRHLSVFFKEEKDEKEHLLILRSGLSRVLENIRNSSKKRSSG
jgi:hypothetical protein